jgi:UDP-N-acetyl-D-mannosaminuronate dehydrogenase
MKNSKDVVVGLGEIGMPILKLLAKSKTVVGYDVNPKLMNINKFEKHKDAQTIFLNICIPFSDNFESSVKKLYKQFLPKCIVIHSTISPYTTKKLQLSLKIPIIYSATRGVHKRMLADLKKYTKFYALEKTAPKKQWASKEFSKIWSQSGVKTKKMSEPITLELAKTVVDTSYYGWLINYAQLSNMIAKKHGVDYDEMWSFADEIQKYLKNRPKMFPGFIGGHCVIPNLSLINEDSLWEIDKINNIYSKKIGDAKSIAKKYSKGKQSYDK